MNLLITARGVRLHIHICVYARAIVARCILQMRICVEYATHARHSQAHPFRVEIQHFFSYRLRFFSGLFPARGGGDKRCHVVLLIYVAPLLLICGLIGGRRAICARCDLVANHFGAHKLVIAYYTCRTLAQHMLVRMGHKHVIGILNKFKRRESGEVLCEHTLPDADAKTETV